jgi:hypothetical protein
MLVIVAMVWISCREVISFLEYLGGGYSPGVFALLPRLPLGEKIRQLASADWLSSLLEIEAIVREFVKPDTLSAFVSLWFVEEKDVRLNSRIWQETTSRKGQNCVYVELLQQFLPDLLIGASAEQHSFRNDHRSFTTFCKVCHDVLKEKAFGRAAVDSEIGL